MTRPLLLGVCVALAGAAGCATTSTTGTSTAPSATLDRVSVTGSWWADARLRDSDGHPLPAYALEDTNLPLLQIRCADGNDYQIALDRKGDLYGPGNVRIYHVAEPGSDQTMCNRILGDHPPR